MDSGGGKAMSASERAALMSNVQQQVALAQAQEMLQAISEKCFKMCISKPSTSLSNSEQVKQHTIFLFFFHSFYFFFSFCSQEMFNILHG